MALLDGLAQMLAARGLVNFQASGTGGDCYLEWLPPAPDAIVSLWEYQGSEADARLAHDYPNVQVRTRAADPTSSRARCQALVDALHGFSGRLPDGTAVEQMLGTNPTPIGQDAAGRYEHTASFRTVIRRDAAIAAGRE